MYLKNFFMINKNLKITVVMILLFMSVFSSPLRSDEIKELSDSHEYNFYRNV